MSRREIVESFLPILPWIAAMCWLGMILALLAIWLTEGSPDYKLGEAAVVFISDVGAANQKIFITVASLTVLFYLSTLIALYFLRKRHPEVPGDTTKGQKVAAVFTVFWAVVASAALILLTIFDAIKHDALHWIFTLIFMASIIISAVANVFEVRGLKKAWGRRHLKVSAAVKLAVVTFCFCAGITMVGLMSSCGTASGQPLSPHCNTIESAAAVLEWTIAFLITVYFLSFVADLWPVAEVGVEAVQEMVSAPRETNVGARNAMEPLSSVVAIDGQSPPPRYFDGRLGGNFSAENGTREPYEDIPFNDPYPVARGA